MWYILTKYTSFPYLIAQLCCNEANKILAYWWYVSNSPTTLMLSNYKYQGRNASEEDIRAQLWKMGF
jgi:hypothetical protein